MPLQNNPLFTESYPTSQSACLERCHDTHSDGVYTGGLEASSAPVLGESKTCLQNPLAQWKKIGTSWQCLSLRYSEIFEVLALARRLIQQIHHTSEGQGNQASGSVALFRCGRPILMKYAFPSLERPRLWAKIIPSPFWSQVMCK